MNIFFVNSDPVIAAKSLCNRHIVKMGLESVQMLCQILPQNLSPYKHTHSKHPSTLWTLRSDDHFKWHVEHASAIFTEYTRRYKKIHKSQLALYKIIEVTDVLINQGRFHTLFPRHDFTPPPQCMPEIYQCSDTVTAYRKFYAEDKSSFAVWPTIQDIPDWWPHPKEKHISRHEN